MTARDLFQLVIANLSRMRGRALMTAMGVLIGTAAIVVLIALASGLQQSTNQSFADFGPLNQITVLPSTRGRFFGPPSGELEQEALLTPDKIREFREYNGVQAVTPIISVNASQVRLNRLQGFTTLTGIDAREVSDMGFVMAQGTDNMGRWTVLAGSRVGENFVDARGRSVDEPVELYGQTLLLKLSRVDDEGNVSYRTIRLRVGGVLEGRGGSDDSTIFLSLEDADEINSWVEGRRINYDHDGYSQAIVVSDDPGLMLLVEDRIQDQGFFAFSARSALQQINLFFAIVQAVFGGIGAIALVVAAIGIANTMIMSILERTREIGLMKAVGATNRDVMSVFVAEAGAIGVLGGIGGVLFGVGAAKIIDLIAQAYIAAQLAASGSTDTDPTSIAYIPAWLPVFAIIFSLFIGLGSGIYPALRAVQLDPVAALKYE